MDVDLTDTFTNAPVWTIAGQQGLSIQLIDQSPIAFDDVVFRDLVADYASKLDNQVIVGSGTSGQVLGVHNTTGIATVATSGSHDPRCLQPSPTLSSWCTPLGSCHLR